MITISEKGKPLVVIDYYPAIADGCIVWQGAVRVVADVHYSKVGIQIELL